MCAEHLQYLHGRGLFFVWVSLPPPLHTGASFRLWHHWSESGRPREGPTSRGSFRKRRQLMCFSPSMPDRAFQVDASCTGVLASSPEGTPIVNFDARDGESTSSGVFRLFPPSFPACSSDVRRYRARRRRAASLGTWNKKFHIIRINIHNLR